MDFDGTLGDVCVCGWAGTCLAGEHRVCLRNGQPTKLIDDRSPQKTMRLSKLGEPHCRLEPSKQSVVTNYI